MHCSCRGGLPHFRRATIVSATRGRYDAFVSFRENLQREFARRRAANARYSLRAFAGALGVDHSTLSQIVRGTRRVTARTLRALGARLGMSAAAIELQCAAENESAILGVVARSDFRANSRWIAVVLGMPLDEVNVALQTLLRRRQLILGGRRWQTP